MSNKVKYVSVKFVRKCKFLLKKSKLDTHLSKAINNNVEIFTTSIIQVPKIELA